MSNKIMLSGIAISSIRISIITISMVAGLVLVGSVLIPVAGVAAAVSSPVKVVTSADSAGGFFFGQGSVQIVIFDQSAKSGGGVIQATVPVSIIAESQGKRVAADTFDIPETVLGSGKFELYLTHKDSIFSNGFGIHPLNTFGIGHITNKSEALQLSNPAVGKVAPVITFGLKGDLDTGTKLFEDVSFKVLYGDQEVLLFYQHTPSQLMLDRSTYGSGSTIHVFISDQDANLNPTVPVQFSVNKDQLPNLFSLSGGAFKLNGNRNITFTETAPDTAIFEGEFRLNDTIIPTAKSLVLTLHDKADYNNVNSVANDYRTGTSAASFIIEDTDGTLDLHNFTFAKGLSFTLTDPDQNRDSEVLDMLQGKVIVAIEGVGGDSETVNMIETQPNSGTFVVDSPSNELKATFTAGATTKNNGVLEFTSQNIHNLVDVTYSDPQNHEGKPESFIGRVNLDTTAGNITLPSSVSLNERFVLSINHPDLNNNPHSIVSYSFSPVLNKPVPLLRGNEALGEFARLEVQVITPNNSSQITSAGNKTTGYTGTAFILEETGANTGIFESRIGVKDLANALGYSIIPGDKIRITYFDSLISPIHVSSAVMNII